MRSQPFYPMSNDSKDSASHDRQRDIRRLANILRSGGYSYDQSKHLVAEARKAVGLTPPKREKGSVDRLTAEEVDQLLGVTYEEMGAAKGLMVRTLLGRPRACPRFAAFKPSTFRLEKTRSR